MLPTKVVFQPSFFAVRNGPMVSVMIVPIMVTWQPALRSLVIAPTKDFSRGLCADSPASFSFSAFSSSFTAWEISRP